MANNDEYTDEYNANTYVVIFLSVSIFGRGYHSRYQNFEFTGGSPTFDTEKKRKQKNQARRLYNFATPYGQAEKLI